MGDKPMVRNCFTDYIGCMGDLYGIIKDYAIPGRKVIRKCKWKNKKNKRRCITILNDENVKLGNIYCSMHQQILEYGTDTPWTASKKSSNKEG